MTKKIRFFALAFILIALCGIGSCDRLIYTDLSQCPHGVRLRFYAATPCAENDHLYPREIDHLKIFVFDRYKKLEYHTEMKNVVFNDKLISDLIPLRNSGNYRFVVWGGAGGDDYAFNEIKEGATEEEVLLTLQKTTGNIRTGSLHPLYYGINSTHTATGEEGTYADTLAVRMNENTNRIRVNLQGVTPAIKEKISMEIRDNNTRYDAANRITEMPEIAYKPAVAPSGDDKYTANFHLLKLEEGRQPKLCITYTDVSGKPHTTEQNLVEAIKRGYPLLGSLDCRHDYEIDVRFETDATQTYMTIHISVNGWTVHSYEIDLRV